MRTDAEHLSGRRVGEFHQAGLIQYQYGIGKRVDGRLGRPLGSKELIEVRSAVGPKLPGHGVECLGKLAEFVPPEDRYLPVKLAGKPDSLCRFCHRTDWSKDCAYQVGGSGCEKKSNNAQTDRKADERR